MEISKHKEIKENENTPYKNLWDLANTVLKRDSQL